MVSLIIMESLLKHAGDMQYVITINPKLIWIILIIVWIIFVLTSAVIFYHWFTYSYTPKTISRAVKIYLIGSGIFIAIGIISALIYTFSI